MSESLSYRCSNCNKNWPLTSKFAICPLCETKCWSHSDGDVLTIAEALAIIEAEKQPAAKYHAPVTYKDGEEVQPERVKEATHSSIHSSGVFEHRYGFFMRLGFGPAESEALANTYLDTHNVRKMVEQGCSLEQAVAILL